jgi:peptidoglycan/xylan/chitin deacetylase (PgdA/CDA1 family)
VILVRWLAGLGARGGRAGGLTTLIFHRVRARTDPLFPEELDAARFDTLLHWVRESFCVLPLGRAVTALQQGSLPARALSITFDDGYADNHSVALPILARHGLGATFFVASGFLDGGRMWNDTIIEAIRATSASAIDMTDDGLDRYALSTPAERRQAIDRLIGHIKYLAPTERAQAVERVARACAVALPPDLMMTTMQLRDLRAAGMDIGGHTVNHPILTRLDDAAAKAEIANGKAQLEALLDEPLSLFAYPNGKPDQDFAARHAAMARRAGYLAAVSTAPGVARPEMDCFQLPRFTPWDQTPLRFGLRLVRNMSVTARVAQ